jgi:hypothetical protein
LDKMRIRMRRDGRRREVMRVISNQAGTAPAV